MSSKRRAFVEDLVASAAELPPPAAPLRKRVMKSARQAQHGRTVRRRIQWSLGCSAAAIGLAVWVNVLMTPAPNANNSAYQHASPANASGASSHPDWDVVDDAKRERAQKAGAIHGSF